MIRLIRQWVARRRLAQHRKANIARMATAPKRDAWGRFAKGKIA
jgi:hypothetical protein